MAIGDAISRGLLDRNIVTQLLQTISNQSLGCVIDKGLVDLTSGKAVDGKTKNEVANEEAFDSGCWMLPESSSLMLKTTS